jgi:N-acyl amino acid synthase of PEP-CTERM/exosortase system
MSNYSVADNFNQFFKIKFADTKELRQEAFKIRYGVYSAELGWEPENLLKMETDECDDYAYHCVLEHRRTGAYAGCVRLVIPPANNKTLKLPFESNCLHAARTNIVDSTVMERGSFGEISRLAVLESFRRRGKEENVPFVLKEIDPKTVYTEEERRNFPNIAMGLYLGAVALAKILNHKGMFVMMEPRLNKRLQRFGLPFQQAGDEMNYHGNRAMFYLERENFDNKLNEEIKEFFNMVHDDLYEQMTFLPYTDACDR